MTEQELCDLLIEQAKELGFSYYPEYEGWDLVLSRGRVIIGIQAKLKLNIKVLAQTADATGVTFKVILLEHRPERGERFRDYLMVTTHLKFITIIPNYLYGSFDGFSVYPIVNYRNIFSFRHHPKKLLTLPNFNYETPAGVRSPRKVTENNINLVRLEIFALKNGGFIRLADARRFGFDRIPRMYYTYNPRNKIWVLKPEKWRASKDYPHIYQGILEKENIHI